MRPGVVAALACCVGTLACGSSSAPPSPTPAAQPTPPASATGCARTSVGLTPLTDLGAGSYKGEPGGLYGEGSNVRPAGHETEGRARARAIVPRDRNGLPSGSGRYALVSVGMSNTTQEFSAFKQLADADLSRDQHLSIVDGAQGGQTAASWSQPGCACWGTLDARLAAAGVSAGQVAAVWLKLADAGPAGGWPGHAVTLRNETETVVRLLAQRFPNLSMVYLSSRIYAGYATSTLNPEPYAYESAFSVRWLITDQIRGSGGLGYSGAEGIPWLSWGPYLWADGLIPRSDGLTWACSDLSSADGTHPSSTGQTKVAQQLLTFFSTDSTARLWYLAR